MDGGGNGGGGGGDGGGKRRRNRGRGGGGGGGGGGGQPAMMDAAALESSMLASAGGGGGGGGGGRRRGKGGSTACYTCGQEGHRSAECPSASGGGGQAPPRPPQAAAAAPAAAYGGAAELPAPPAMSTVPKKAAGPPLSSNPADLFSSLPISPKTKQAIASVLGYTHMTPVQASTLPIIIQGIDVLAKAKTGTGKTLGFLIPSIEVTSFFNPLTKRGPAKHQEARNAHGSPLMIRYKTSVCKSAEGGAAHRLLAPSVISKSYV